MWSSPTRKRGRTRRSAYLLHISEQTAFGQRHTRRTADDQVIENSNIHERHRLDQPFGNSLVGLRRLRDARRCMVVHQCHRGRPVVQGRLDDLARMHAGAIKGAAEKFDVFNEATLCVHRAHGEDLMVARPKFYRKKIAHRLSVRQRGPAPESARHRHLRRLDQLFR